MEPIFLTLEDVEQIHADSLEAWGGSPGLRDRGLLESAVYTPQAGFGGEYLHKTLYDMAAAYAFHIAENQPFVDGNKRTALGAALAFLGANGVMVQDPGQRLYQAMMAVSAKAMSKTDLAGVFEDLVRGQET